MLCNRLHHVIDDLVIDKWPHRIVHEHNIVRLGAQGVQSICY